MKKGILSLLISIYSTSGFAMFCPSNFNQINIGDTLQQVEAQCGKPLTSVTTKSTANLPQEWTYYATLPSVPPVAPNASQGTMKVTFAFVNNKLTNITSNGLGVGATTICNNVNLQLGNSTEDVEKACGKAAIVTQTNLQNAAAATPPPTETTTWTYDSTPAVTLIFVDGKLKERK